MKRIGRLKATEEEAVDDPGRRDGGRFSRVEDGDGGSLGRHKK